MVFRGKESSLGMCSVSKRRKELNSDEPAFLAPPLKADRVAIDRSSTEAGCMQATRPALFLCCVLPCKKSGEQ